MKKILIVDDEADIRRLIQISLEETGLYEIRSTGEPQDVLGICREFHPDMLLLDIVMPIMDGRDIIAQIRSQEEFEHMLIIVTSGLGEMVYSQKMDQWKWSPNRPIVQQRGDIPLERNPHEAARAYGVDDFIVKPFSPRSLHNIIADNFEKHS
ncbi:MAG: response regulator [Candidatus Omnitrophota bacterium]